MSAEKINTNMQNNVTPLKTPQFKEKVLPKRVDINHLLARVRKQEQKDNFTNLVFLGLFLTLVLVSGIILSL
tara:strand:+ start:350 stop:565 length:216 start_codon:yes stop_codon:yes gene_type:complete